MLEPSSVHAVETTAEFTDAPTYQSYLVRRAPEEWDIARVAYEGFGTIRLKAYLPMIDACRTFSWFSRNLITGEVTLFNNSCRLRWCPLCSRAKSYFITESVTEWIRQAEKPKFLTLTIKHSADPLHKQIDHLYDSFRKLRKIKRFSSRIRGGCWFFQVKRSSDGLSWHPHLHCLLDCEFIPQAYIKKCWEGITQTSSIVDIRPVWNPAKTAEYVARYTGRPAVLSKFSYSDQLDIMDTLHGRRICGTWGTASGISFKPPRISDKSEWEHVGTWSQVVGQLMTSTDARCILRAWKLNERLEEGISLIPLTHREMHPELYERQDMPWEIEPYLPGLYDPP